MLLFSLSPGNPAGASSSGRIKRFRKTSRLTAIQELWAFFIFVFSVIYFLHLRFLKTRNRWTNPSSSEQTAYQTPHLEDPGPPAECRVHKIIHSNSSTSGRTLTKLSTISLSWSHYQQLWERYVLIWPWRTQATQLPDTRYCCRQQHPQIYAKMNRGCGNGWPWSMRALASGVWWKMRNKDTRWMELQHRVE